ncbi:protoporphyrinogen oxidase [Halostella sp. JP-L12]|uniref:flavodoxin domain-containing protein n=1 Tax=Halostella TaxID=1843185 RepID=UPI000EF83CD6|nr:MULTISPECIES: flavodoxin domain-containing protein [Halostella]NHN49304.1 protoporphyrinogen oxidase [Halostella sp. JP-L12]
MLSFLVIYGTGEGQTAKVADRIVAALKARGHDAVAVDVDTDRDIAVTDYDAVVVGASIHTGKHQREIREFVRRHRETLTAVPTAFFQVSLSSASEEGRAAAADYVETFVEDTGWHPDRIGQFGGALRYSEYSFLKRLLMKQIVKRNPPDATGHVEPSGDIEYTDWTEVEAFAADVAAFVEGRLGVTPPAGDGPNGGGGAATGLGKSDSGIDR